MAASGSQHRVREGVELERLLQDLMRSFDAEQHALAAMPQIVAWAPDGLGVGFVHLDPGHLVDVSEAPALQERQRVLQVAARVPEEDDAVVHEGAQRERRQLLDAEEVVGQLVAPARLQRLPWVLRLASWGIHQQCRCGLAIQDGSPEPGPIQRGHVCLYGD